MRKNRGITLITLAITIIILLILAGISIATLTGENGILGKASKAKEEHLIEQYKEEINLIITDEIAERKIEEKDELMIVSLNNKIEKKKEDWVKEIYKCNSKKEEQQTFEESTHLLVESKEHYEYLIEVNEEKQTAQIVSSQKGTGEKYTITYNANEGEGQEETIEIRQGFLVTLKECNYTRDQYKFVGWCESQNGEGERFLGNANYKPEGNITLYAIWELNVATITLNSNDGNNNTRQVTVTKGKETRLPANTFTRKTYQFLEWNTKADRSGTKYEDGANINLEQDITLYAIWEIYIPSTVNTTPFLPEGATIDEEHYTLDNGFVIKDANQNEWVWIEVPKSIYENTTYNGGTAPTSSQDYAKIESVMKAYASAYRQSGYTDTFYSKAQYGFENATEYNNWKNSMLKSVYENGGFYIGRYEVGTNTPRYTNNDALTRALIKRDKYPYNWVTSSQAQILAKQLAIGKKTSSLMFGIQWDLVMKFIEVKGTKTQAELKTDSTTWGNYKNAMFDVKREEGLYTTLPSTKGLWNTTSNYAKPNSGVLLTTRATDRNSVLGICDLAGNVYEWTLEYTSNTGSPCGGRGGSYDYDGFDHPATYHGGSSTTRSNGNIGFRPVLW